MFLNALLSQEMILSIHKTIISRLRSIHSDLSNLETRNTRLHTKIYEDLDKIENWILNGYILQDNEYPILECCLENGNYFLMTTERMVSEYLGTKYEITYQDFFKFDPELLLKNREDEESKTLIYKGYAQNKENIKQKGAEFIFEIDSGRPAYFASNQILFFMIQVGIKTFEGIDIIQTFLGTSKIFIRPNFPQYLL